MFLYIRNDLFKAEKEYKNRGSQVGGAYVARVADGEGPDGKVKYKYFRDVDSYKTYLANKGKSKDKGDKSDKDKDKKESLKDKLKKEHKDKTGPKEKPSLFVKEKEHKVVDTKKKDAPSDE